MRKLETVQAEEGGAVLAPGPRVPGEAALELTPNRFRARVPSSLSFPNALAPCQATEGRKATTEPARLAFTQRAVGCAVAADVAVLVQQALPVSQRVVPLQHVLGPLAYDPEDWK